MKFGVCPVLKALILEERDEASRPGLQPARDDPWAYFDVIDSEDGTEKAPDAAHPDP